MKNKLFYLFIAFLLLLGFYYRVVNIDKLLAFHYDQGRDALIIWDFIHNGKFFLIGPTTGIAGIFRGPWYYWLITPFYWLGKGNPVWPSIFLSLTTVIASLFLYFLVIKATKDKILGVFGLILSLFSLQFVLSARWLSNPTPMYLISMLYVFGLYKFLDSKRWGIVFASAMFGVAMQFGSATELFYAIPLLTLIILKFKKIGWKYLMFSCFAFLFFFIPQIIFDYRHDHILLNNVKDFLFKKDAFRLSFWEVVKVRTPFYFEVFYSKIFTSKELIPKILFIFPFLGLFIIKKNKFILISLLTIASPLIGMLFFQGNEGNVYDYYFTGYYLIFILNFILLISLFKNMFLIYGFSFIFIYVFLTQNVNSIKGYVFSGSDGEETINLEIQKKALDWIFDDAKDKKFNFDVYVPPVIPYSYEYLVKWYGQNKYSTRPSVENVELLYTLAEIDPPHPERYEAWMKRQKRIGKVVEFKKYGGILVQKRIRLYEKNI